MRRYPRYPPLGLLLFPRRNKLPAFLFMIAQAHWYGASTILILKPGELFRSLRTFSMMMPGPPPLPTLPAAAMAIPSVSVDRSGMLDAAMVNTLL